MLQFLRPQSICLLIFTSKRENEHGPCFAKPENSLFRPLLIPHQRSRTWKGRKNSRAQKCKTNDASDFLEFARENSNSSAIFDSSSFFPVFVSTFQSQTRRPSMRSNYQFFSLPFVNYSTVDCHNCEIEIHIFPPRSSQSSSEVLISALFTVVVEEFREKWQAPRKKWKP